MSDAQRAVNLALEMGANQAEAFVSENTVTTVRIASRRILEAKKVREGGIGVCAAIGNKVGYSSGNFLTQELMKRAVAIARARPPNPDFNGFPGPKKAKRVTGVFDKSLENIHSAKPVELAEEALQAALDFDKHIADASGAINIIVEHCYVANSNGVQATDATTKIFGHLTAEAQSGDRSEGQGWLGSTTLKDFKPGLVGKRAAEAAVMSLHAEPAKPGSYDIVLEPNAAAELFYHVLSYAVNGRDVYDRMSYFGDKLGKPVAAKGLSVDDWGNMPSGLSSKAIDDEGTPTQRTPLIRNGRLVNFIYDWYYGGLAKRRTTGNGLRLGDFGRSHQLSPAPCATNLFVKPGDLSREELIGEVKNGLLISRLWYTYPITPQLGDFSTTSRCGFFIPGGEATGGVRQVRIHENLPKLLKQLDGVGNDAEQVIPWGAAASVCTPSLRFRRVRVT